MKPIHSLKNMPAAYSKKELVIFDLDGTLTPSKSDITPDVAAAVRDLLKKKKVAVIGGGTYRQFRKQFVAGLGCPPALLKNLFLFPTTATAFYHYKKGWKNVYESKLTEEQKAVIAKAFRDSLKKINCIAPAKIYGKLLDDRGSQMTYSFLGQDVVAKLGAKGLLLKAEWVRKNTALKLKIAKLVQKELPNLEVRSAGFTSIDVTKKGIDKAYGVREIKKTLKIPVQKMVFVGDALYPGGNDAAARKSGIDCVAVKGPQETKKVIEKILNIG